MPAHPRGLDCTQTPIFRGGNDLTPKPGEVKVKGGLVQPIRGVSLHADPTRLQRFGGAYRVKSIPPELEIVQQGRDPGHFELRPTAPMTPERFNELLKQVELEPPP
jgi:hypothetical protein